MKADDNALISIHDVMPETLFRVEKILRYLKEHGIPPVTLLVVPGRNWNPGQISRLRELAEEGHELAAHGWHHHAHRITRLYHRLHSLLISRNVAEHLALDSQGIRDLMIASSNWFGENELPTPTLYVPPAWALGPLRREHMKQLPYQRIEVLRGFLDPATGVLHKSPMVGFEADTRFRAFFVQRWNRYQLKVAARQSLSLRISIHPKDFSLRLGHDLRSLLTSQSNPNPNPNFAPPENHPFP